MKFFTLFAAIVLWGGLWATVSAEQKSWKTSYPPTPIELDQAILQAFAQKFDATVSGDKVPFARRLNQLQNGDIDILAGLLKNSGREQFAHFLSSPYKQKTDKYFFMREGEGHRLQKYEDLRQLSIGVQIGSKYFPRFDQDTTLRKYSISQDETRFKMLVQGRFDVLIHTDVYGLDIMYKLGLQDKLEIAPYRYTKQNPVFIAISYQSNLIEQKDELETVFRDMVKSGEMDQVIHRYFTNEGLPVPDYK